MKLRTELAVQAAAVAVSPLYTPHPLNLPVARRPAAAPAPLVHGRGLGLGEATFGCIIFFSVFALHPTLSCSSLPTVSLAIGRTGGPPRQQQQGAAGGVVPSSVLPSAVVTVQSTAAAAGGAPLRLLAMNPPPARSPALAHRVAAADPAHTAQGRGLGEAAFFFSPPSPFVSHSPASPCPWTRLQ